MIVNEQKAMKQEDIKNLTVEEFTTPCPKSVLPEATLKEVEFLMRKEGVRHLPIIDAENKIVGIVSERDVHCAYRVGDASQYMAKDIMHPDPYIVDENTKISEVAFGMSERKIGSALVRSSEHDELGIFTSTDALNALIEIVRGDIQS